MECSVGIISGFYSLSSTKNSQVDAKSDGLGPIL